jgi:hypothetical protein
MSTHASNPPKAKIKIELAPSDWHGYRIENVWVELLDDGTCRLCNTPFYAYGLSYCDRVSVEERGSDLYYKALIESGGHRTYRIIMPREFDASAKAAFERHWAPIQALGCSYESTAAPLNLFAVDVPPTADVSQVQALLQAGRQDSTWDYELSAPRSDRVNRP